MSSARRAIAASSSTDANKTNFLGIIERPSSRQSLSRKASI
jgi:hypothetical protein